MALPSRKTTLASLSLAALLLLVGLPFLNLNRFRGRLESAISGSLNRRVTLGDVRFRLLPTPAFDIANFIVEDDPAFSAEPMLRAEEVIASLRWTSLWRGRLEISQLSVRYPSLNLVRMRDGRWNLETLLTRAASVSAAPTANTRVEDRPRFPYIEAVAGRINYKSEQEKMVWAVTDADFALWLESENKWRMRLEGQPLRTDENLSDAGRIRLDGQFERAATLRKTPLNLTILVQHAQLGQLTKLASGRDRGWRGGVDAAATLTGMPQDLKITSQLLLTDFRRYDISTTEQIRMDVHCSGEFHSGSSPGVGLLQNYLAAGECAVPSGGGEIRLRGGSANGRTKPGSSGVESEFIKIMTAVATKSEAPESSLTAAGTSQAPKPDSPLASGRYLVVEVKDFPISSLLMGARRVKKELPADLSASGVMNAAFSLRQPSAGAPLDAYTPRGWTGTGAVTGLTLRSSVLGTNLSVGNVPITMNPGATVAVGAPRAPISRAGKRKPVAVAREGAAVIAFEPLAEGTGNCVVVGPLALSLDGPAPATAAVQITRPGFHLNLQGGADPARLLSVAQALGLPRLPQGYRLVPRPPADSKTVPAAGISGAAVARPLVEVDLHVAGEWANFAPPRLQGSAKLHNITAEIAAISKPLEIESGTLNVSADEISAKDMIAAIPDSHLQLEGSINFPRRCASPQLCVMGFDIKAAQVDLDELNRLVNPRLRAGLWSYLRASLPGSGPGPAEPAGVSNFWKGRRAQGHLSTNRLIIKLLTASQVSADVDLQGDKLLLTNTRATLLGGTYQGQWSGDFSMDPPVFDGSGAALNVSLTEIATLMHDDWATGPATINFRVTFFGRGFDDYKRSAIAAVGFNWKKGLLRHVVLDGGTPISFTEWAGKAEVANQGFLFTPGRMQTKSGTYTAEGTASFARNINFNLAGAKSRYAISGTLRQPVVFPPPQAALKTTPVGKPAR